MQGTHYVDLDLVSVAPPSHVRITTLWDGGRLSNGNGLWPRKGAASKGRTGVIQPPMNGPAPKRSASLDALASQGRLRAVELSRSRGGLTSKIHLFAERGCRPLSLVLTPRPGRRCASFHPVMDKFKVCGPGGRPRTRPRAATGDNACSSRANRAYLRPRRITAVISKSRPSRQP